MKLFKSFWKDESGMEFLQLAIIIIIVAALAAAVWALAQGVLSKLEEAQTEIEGITMPPQNP